VARRTRRNLVKAVRGKVVEDISIGPDDDGDYIEIDIKFTDNTSLGIQIASRMSVERVDLLGWRKGDSHIIKELY
jgi:hypothetical protein